MRLCLKFKILLICGILIFIVGCDGGDTGPVIVRDTPISNPPVQPQIIKPAPVPPIYQRDWYSFSYGTTERHWTTIIVHHSATPNGNMATFDEEHKKRGWNGVGYDFVIGNGTYSGDGQVEVTYRWKQQVTGAHTGETPNNWANETGIGICLVGDFNRTYPTPKQMASLAQLVKFLQIRYGIPSNRIYGHGTVPGGHATDCPGRNFSMPRLKSML